MKLKLTLIACAAFLAFPLGAYAQSESSETNGVPGGTISTPGSESKGNPIPLLPQCAVRRGLGRGRDALGLGITLSPHSVR